MEEEAGEEEEAVNRSIDPPVAPLPISYTAAT